MGGHARARMHPCARGKVPRVASRVLDPHVRLLYTATFLFGMACGISISLTSIHLNGHGYTKHDIGSLAAIFATGIVLMSLPAGALIRRFSAKSTLVASMASYAACVAAFPFLPTYSSIAVVRFIDGASSVGIWVASETILLSRTRNEDKAHYTSLYAIFLASGYVFGPAVANGLLYVAPMQLAFVASGVFAIGAAVYLAIRLQRDVPGAAPAPSPAAEEEKPATKEEKPAPEEEKPASSLDLLRRIKISCFATFAYGYFQSAVVLFLPLYLIEAKGIPKEQTIAFFALFALGMLLLSNPAGRIADRVGHLRVMRGLAVVGTLMILGFVFLDSYLVMCVAVFIAGATLAAIAPVSLALQGIVIEKRSYSRSNAIYNVFYASGMLLGPPISGHLFERYSGKEMLFHLAGLWAAFVVFTIVFYADDPAVAKRRLAQSSSV